MGLFNRKEVIEKCSIHGCPKQMRLVPQEPRSVDVPCGDGFTSEKEYPADLKVYFCPQCEAEVSRIAAEEQLHEQASQEEDRKRMVARDKARAVKKWCKCFHTWQSGELFCPNCGQKNPNPSFCTKCGNTVGTCSHTQ